MKNTIVWFVKLFFSGIIAFAVLTCFCLIYYNRPVHHDNEDMATDYAWERGRFYSSATEGFAWGKTNNEGFINEFDYSANDPIDILVMGSSHMEALQVAMDETTAAVIGKLLPEYRTYNIGMSSHHFLVCADNISSAVSKYMPQKYVVLETADILFTDEELISAINEDVPDLVSHSDGLIGLLQKNQLLRLLYLQMTEFIDNSDSPDNEENTNDKQVRGDEWLYDELLRKMADDVSVSGAQLIIVYHPSLVLNEDGSVSAVADEEMNTFFADACSRNDVVFLDMTDNFIRNYTENHVLPHGFSNSSVGYGHLNKYGHEMIANSVCDFVEGK